MKSWFARIAGLILLLLPLGELAQAKPSRPNIVVIFADDLGWADLPAYGNRITEAPNIDRLVREGARFTRFYGQPVCSPSRAELMSGNYPARYGLTDFIPGHWRPFERVVTPLTVTSFDPPEPPIGKVMQALGYRTAYFGKWHLGELGSTPEKTGFEEKFVGYGMNHMADPTTPSADAMATRAEQFIAGSRDKPFLLMLSPTQPHIPLRAHRADIAHFHDKLQKAGADLPVAEYGGMVLDFDRLIGRVMAALDARGLASNTLFIVTSDNGGLEHTDFGIDTPVTSNAPLRSEKGTVYEGGIRIPLIVRWPGVTKPGSTVNTPASLMDILPTLAEAGGGKVDGRDGRSLVPVLRRPDRSLSRALYYHYPHYHHGRPASAMIEGDWKLIQNLDDDSIELYNLASDIGESRPLQAERPERAAAMLARLQAWRAWVHARMPTPNPSFNPARAPEWWDIVKGTPYPIKRLRAGLAPSSFPDGEQ